MRLLCGCLFRHRECAQLCQNFAADPLLETLDWGSRKMWLQSCPKRYVATLVLRFRAFGLCSHMALLMQAMGMKPCNTSLNNNSVLSQFKRGFLHRFIMWASVVLRTSTAFLFGFCALIEMLPVFFHSNYMISVWIIFIPIIYHFQN